MRYPGAVVEDDEYHFGRTVSVDLRTQDTAAIGCGGCDPGTFKTAKVTAGAGGFPGSASRGAVYIYQGSESSGFRKWTATQLLWPRHNKWYYFGNGFTQVDGNTLVADACRGAACTADTFAQREYNAPSTDLFVYVKQDVTGLWSEQQVLTDTIMEMRIYSKYFQYVKLHDDTIAMGVSLSVKVLNSNKYTQGVEMQRGLVRL